MVDKKLIQEQVNAVLAYSQDFDREPQTDNLIDIWFNAKRDIIEAFGGKLIYEAGPTTFNLSKEEQDEKISDFINRCERVYDNSSLAWFLYRNKAGFFDNAVVEGTTMPTGETICKGMKLLKAFKFFETDETVLKTLQTEASMIIQENKVEGILCFSVHPLDYLSSSENTYNWRSCHSLDGEFRSGNLTYMCDQSTIVCYLRGKDEQVHLPRFPDNVLWNSKKWRMLLFLSESWQSIFAGRQYPFVSEAGLEIITPHLRKALKQNESAWSAWHNDVITSVSYKNGQDDDFTHKTIVMGHKYYEMQDLISDGKQSRHFNDLLRSSCYTPFYQWNKMHAQFTRNDKYPGGYGEHFTIGAAAPCIACGTASIALSDAMYCDCCCLDYCSDDNDNMSICDCCGARVWNDDMYTTIDESWICEHCANTECIRCARCGELVFNDDANYDRNSGHYYCDDCYTEVRNEEN